MFQKGNAILIIIIILAAALGGWYWYSQNKDQGGDMLACPQDAKICPDGSAVGRTGPNCEFAACPNEVVRSSDSVDTSDWKTYRSENYGFEIRYPNDYRVLDVKLDPDAGDLAELMINGPHNGSADAQVMEIKILENTTGGAKIADLRNEVMKFYGATKWPFNFPREDAKVSEFSLNNQPAIKSNYGEPREGSDITDPAVLVFTLNSQYVYRIFFINDASTGDQILSTLKFTN